MGKFSTSFARGISSSNVLTNQKQAGPQMYGLPPTETASVAQARAYKIAALPQRLSDLIMPLNAVYAVNRPTGGVSSGSNFTYAPGNLV